MIQKTIQLYKNAYSGLSKEIWLLSFISLVNRAGAMVFPFMTIYLTHNLGFSLKEAGIIMGFFGLGSIFGAYIGGWLTDRIGAYSVQIASLIGAGMVLLFLVTAKTFWSIAIISVVFSTISDAFRPANKVAVANYSKPENTTRSFALLRLAINLGFAIGPAMGGLLAAWKGYEWLFYADALTCITAGVLFKFTLKDDFKVSDKGITEKTVEKKEATNVISPYQDPLFLAFLVVMALMSFTFMQMFFVMPVFYKQEMGLSEGQIGLLMGLNGLIIFLTEMPIVYIVEQRLSKFMSMRLGAVLIGLGFFIYLLPSMWIGIAVISVLLFTIGEILYLPFASSFVAERSNTSNRGRYMALYSMSWAAASVIAPSFGFFISEHIGFNGLWCVLFIFGLIGGLGFWLLNNKKASQNVLGKLSLD